MLVDLFVCSLFCFCTCKNPSVTVGKGSDVTTWAAEVWVKLHCRRIWEMDWIREHQSCFYACLITLSHQTFRTWPTSLVRVSLYVLYHRLNWWFSLAEHQSQLSWRVCCATAVSWPSETWWVETSACGSNPHKIKPPQPFHLLSHLLASRQWSDCPSSSWQRLRGSSGGEYEQKQVAGIPAGSLP